MYRRWHESLTEEVGGKLEDMKGGIERGGKRGVWK